MTYAGAIQFLYSLQVFGAKLGLENPRRLAALAGHPEDRLLFVHVAGTNGKGSTCAMLEGMARAAGLRTGLFTSPHLVSFAERIQVNRQLISEEDVARLVGEMQPWMAQFPASHHPTFFEVVTILALRYFEEQQCDLVIWETGLGGRLDATNIVTPLASVITTIDLDHQQWLGHSLNQIAAEKAGIIKPGVPVVTGAQAGRGLEIIVETAARQRASLTAVSDAEAILGELDVALPLPGAHQRFNAALAVVAARALAPRVVVPATAIRHALARVCWPGRLQSVPRPGDRRVVLDGAHNHAGAQALRRAWEEQYPGAPPALVLGVLSDKDWAGMIETLAPLAGRILLVPVRSARGLAPATLVAPCRRVRPELSVEVCASFAEALAKAEQGAERSLLVTGSLYLVGEALEHLGISAAPAIDERGLNEWARLEPAVGGDHAGR